MKKYIAIYGGTNLSKETARFVEDLSFSILENIKDSVIVTGGFHYTISEKGTRSSAISTDYSAYKGAEKFAGKKKVELSKCLETWIPEHEKERNKERVVRFKKGNWEILKGKSAQARRFEIVNRVNLVITIKGRKNTAMVLDFAIVTHKPFLPLAFTGEDSEDYWKDNEGLIKKTFKITRGLEQQLKTFDPQRSSLEEKAKFIKKMTHTLENGLKKICLVLRAYQKESNDFYESELKPAIEDADFIPMDIKEEINDGNIFSIFLKKLETSDAIIADITEANPNVMYEIGHAHARQLPVILYSRRKVDEKFKKHLPFYLSMDKVENEDCSTLKGRKNIINRIKAHLSDKRIKY